MKYLDAVRTSAAALDFLAVDGTLKPLDSLRMVDLIVALEDSTGIDVPAASMREESFESVESLAELLEQFAED